MRKLLLATALICITSCKSNQVTQNSYLKEFYKVLNIIIHDKYENVSVILTETKPIYKTLYGNYDKTNLQDYGLDSLQPPPPPPGGWIYFDREYFDFQVKYNHLDKADAEFMFNSIDSTKIITLDSNSVKINVISIKTFRNFFSDTNLRNAYHLLKEKTGSRCFFETSAVIFNSTFTKAVIAVDCGCGPLSGGGSTFFLEKRDNKWIIIDERGRWVSENNTAPNKRYRS
jgi:hypothetical protein